MVAGWGRGWNDQNHPSRPVRVVLYKVVPMPRMTPQVPLRAMAALALGVIAASPVLAAKAPGGRGGANNLPELRVLQSQNGVLDILMVARAGTAPGVGPLVPTTPLVYDICPRPQDGSEACPATSDDLFAGTRLQLQQGDLLKVHLVNKLPWLADASHVVDPGMSFLPYDPTNLHTHGLIVAPRYPTKTQPTYGDNVFVLALNPDNGMPPPDAEYHSDVKMGSIDYEIRVPADHPSGLFWFHPHIHGISNNQVSSGLSGLITIGKVSDYVCKDAACAKVVDKMPVRHMLIKALQVLPDQSIQSEPDPSFCLLQMYAQRPPQGVCDGIDDFAGGKQYDTINGAVFPTIPVTNPNGEIWRITNGTANTIYDLGLFNSVDRGSMLMQVLSIDGVAVDPRKGATKESLLAAGGAKFDPVACPGVDAGEFKTAGKSVCIRRMLMMPASRAELWVSYRDANGNLAAPPAGTSAVLRQVGHITGEANKSIGFPTMDLANVVFGEAGGGKGAPPSAAAVAAVANGPKALDVAPDAQVLKDPTRIAANLRGWNIKVGAEPKCAPLAEGHYRRIFLGTAGETRAFGMGYEEIDQDGNVVPGSTQEITPFNPDKPTICLTLGPGNTPMHEKWEVINVADEDHTLHIHQVRFSLLTQDRISKKFVPADGILHDGIPLRRVTWGDCETVAAWHDGKCHAKSTFIDVPFAVAGDFVYHCHILEHEDGGMMSRIRVRANP